MVFEGPPKIQQTLWPVHCVQKSFGSELHPQLRVKVLLLCMCVSATSWSIINWLNFRLNPRPRLFSKASIPMLTLTRHSLIIRNLVRPSYKSSWKKRKSRMCMSVVLPQIIAWVSLDFAAITNHVAHFFFNLRSLDQFSFKSLSVKLYRFHSTWRFGAWI